LGSVRSFRLSTLAGLSGGTAICSLLRTKVVGDAARDASVTVFMVAGLAAANTSAGAPWTICWASVALEPKLNFTVVPGWAASKVLPSSVKVSVREEAANTVRVVACGAAEEAEAAGADADAAVLPESLLEPQAERPATARARGTAMAHRDSRLNTKDS